MPYRLKKVSGGVAVVNKDTGQYRAKHTTMAKAKAQMRLLQGIEHGWRPTKKRKR